MADFDEVSEQGITPAMVSGAIAAFLRTLATPGSRFDRWLEGDDAALTEAELEGYRLFKSYGCVSCHQGANVGGNMYGRMGLMGAYFADRGGEVTQADLGRFGVTGLAEDRHLFKVPSLRLAVHNAPYFHDGSAETLADAIRLMARYQLGRSISRAHVRAIEAFLATLVGERPRPGR
ncbi:cytochrome-c peroxidase [Thiorhodococcus minor]|uniref:cytochrome-c peroxidase n=1 Tax=Thiorhodococcus minor TaxID=57489 RepID=UPI003158FEA6